MVTEEYTNAIYALRDSIPEGQCIVVKIYDNAQDLISYFRDVNVPVGERDTTSPNYPLAVLRSWHRYGRSRYYILINKTESAISTARYDSTYDMRTYGIPTYLTVKQFISRFEKLIPKVDCTGFLALI